MKLSIAFVYFMKTLLSFDIGIKNLAYCLFRYDQSSTEFDFEIIDWNILDISIIEKKNVIDCQSDKLFQTLHDTFGHKEIHYVVIENQPVLKNPVMKTVQIMVYSYFKIGKMLQEEIEGVCMVNAGNKLKFAFNVLQPFLTRESDEFNDIPTSINSKTKYKDTKNASIQYVRALLSKKGHTEQQTYFDKFKKKDDLADTLLQGLYYSYNHIKMNSS